MSASPASTGASSSGSSRGSCWPSPSTCTAMSNPSSRAYCCPSARLRRCRGCTGSRSTSRPPRPRSPPFVGRAVVDDDDGEVGIELPAAPRRRLPTERASLYAGTMTSTRDCVTSCSRRSCRSAVADSAIEELELSGALGRSPQGLHRLHGLCTCSSPSRVRGREGGHPGGRAGHAPAAVHDDPPEAARPGRRPADPRAHPPPPRTPRACATVDLCVGHLGELIQVYFSQAARCPRISSSRCHWEDEPLGTAGALRIVPDLDGTFIAMNGDILTTLDYAELVDFHERAGAALTIATHAQAGRHRPRRDRDRRRPHRGLPREADASTTRSAWASTSTTSARWSYLPADGPCQFPDLVQRLLEAGEEVAGLPQRRRVVRHRDAGRAPARGRGVRGRARGFAT